ncbi:MAG: hypothetical protein J6K42_03910 [Clostridia bacterium]|nr:hypothetical protein [Clostridia bacterium]
MKIDGTLLYGTMEPLTQEKINEINYRKRYINVNAKKPYIEIRNTRKLSSEMLKVLDSNIKIRVIGPFNWADESKRNGGIKFSELEESQHYMPITAVLYTRDELVEIISKMESIEKGMEGKEFSQLEKALYIFEKLRRDIQYEWEISRDYQTDKSSIELRSLRGLLSKRAVCAGFSLIYKELLDRQGIDCKYVSGMSCRYNEDGTLKSQCGHAWNVITINGKNYPLDLTMAIGDYRKGILDNNMSICNTQEKLENFEKTHKPKEKDPYSDLKLDYFDERETSSIETYFRREEVFPNSTFIMKRSNVDASKLCQVDSRKSDDGKYLYKYIYTNSRGQMEIIYSGISMKDCKNAFRYQSLLDPKIIEEVNEQSEAINDVFSAANIEESIRNGTSYIGDIIEKKENGRSVWKAYKSQDIQKKCKAVSKMYTRNDGSSFLIQAVGAKKVNEKIVYRYYIYEEIDGEIKKNTIFTENDIIRDGTNEEAIANIFLIKRDIERSKQRGGYIGGYVKSEHNNIQDFTYDEQIAKLFEYPMTPKRIAEATKDITSSEINAVISKLSRYQSKGMQKESEHNPQISR